MIVKTPFTEQELKLLTELLETATHELQQEINHTDARRMKADLRRRLQGVRRLDERLRMMAGEVGLPQPT